MTELGKWKWERKNCKIVDEEGKKVAEVNVGYTVESTLNERGRLIALVPEMHAALVSLTMLGNGAIPGNSDGNMIARRVLAKLNVPQQKDGS